MGLCKCPKRRVTNQFCFEHRVNVCEYCMVTNHPKCVIQSYLHWLQDSDYNPICEICSRTLNEEECIRLTCYHVFHWSCAESRYRALPRTTAPAGYQCPSCGTPVFPPPNLVSPVADVLKEKLAGVNWARSGLGLPLLTDDQDMKGAASRRSQSPVEHSPFYSNSIVEQRGSPVGESDDESSRTNGAPHSIVQITEEAVNIYDNSVKKGQTRKGYKQIGENELRLNYDHDDNKYKQKSTFAWINRWWKNSLPSSRVRRTGGFCKRHWILLVVVIIVIGALFLLSQRSVDYDSNPFGIMAEDDIRILQKN